MSSAEPWYPIPPDEPRRWDESEPAEPDYTESDDD